jgi:hypothetical protein
MDWMPPLDLADWGDAWEEHGFIMEAAAGDGWGGMICNPQYPHVCCLLHCCQWIFQGSTNIYCFLHTTIQ